MIGKMRPKVADALNRAAFENESVSKQLAHVDTGEMRNSIHVSKTATANDLQAETKVGAEHGIFEELGTVHRPPHPFFMPGFEAASRQLNDELKDVLK